jgi:hypothetical protein
VHGAGFDRTTAGCCASDLRQGDELWTENVNYNFTGSRRTIAALALRRARRLPPAQRASIQPPGESAMKSLQDPGEGRWTVEASIEEAVPADE